VLDKVERFYAIRVKSITNEPLIESGWRKGSWTRQLMSGWLNRFTLDRADTPDLFDSADFFDELTKHFAGVEFEKVFFCPVKEALVDEIPDEIPDEMNDAWQGELV
jgi:hypothetical protein